MTGEVSTLAGFGSVTFLDGVGTNAYFYRPYGITVDSAATVYVADYLNQRVRSISTAGVVSTMAGSPTGSTGYSDNAGSNALFNGPIGISVDSLGSLFVSDLSNNRIRGVSTAGTCLSGQVFSGAVCVSATVGKFIVFPQYILLWGWVDYVQAIIL